MATPYIMPLGFIDRTTDDGAIIMLTNPSDSLALKLDTLITLRRSAPDGQSQAKIHGRITAVGYVTATFSTVQLQMDPDWPSDQRAILKGTPVYLALPGTFEPDPSRTVTNEQAERLRRLARRYSELASPKPPDQPKPQMKNRNGNSP